MSDTQHLFNVSFWNSKMTFQAPATSKQTIQVTGLTQATLNWSFNPQNGCGFDNIVFNGVTLSKNTSGSADVTQYVIANGQNTCVFNYRQGTLTLLDPAACSGIATVSLSITATSAGESARARTPIE